MQSASAQRVRESIFNPDPQHIYVWCGTCVHAADGRYYLYYSFWPRELGFSGWVIHSQIGVAACDSPTGPFEPVGMAVPASGRGCGRRLHPQPHRAYI